MTERPEYMMTTCTGGCSIEACVQDGKLRSTVQQGCYPEEREQPRGCLKGVVFPELLEGELRIKAPELRGRDGELLPVDWDEALDETARRLREIMNTYGPDSVGVIYKGLGGGYVHRGALARLAAQCGWTVIDGLDMNGGLATGLAMTLGGRPAEARSVHWGEADTVLVFGGNLAPACVPDTYFLTRPRESGAKVIVFDPGLSPAASAGDEWFSIRPAAEAAVALGMAKVLLEEGLYDGAYVRRYTDLPLLVRRDTGRRLRAGEVAGLDADPGDFVAWRGGAVAVGPGGLPPMDGVQLTGEMEIALREGGRVAAAPAFQLLCERLGGMSLAEVEADTGIPEADLLRLAGEAAGAKRLHIIYGGGGFQHYHGDLGGRALALLAALTGNIGKAGGGVSVFSGQYRPRLDLTDWLCPGGKRAPHLPYAYLAAGRTETMSAPWPKNGIRALIVGWSNPMDQHNAGDLLRRRVEGGEIELLVSLDFLRTTTARHSHILLPGVSWYEKTELVSSPVHDRLQLMRQVIPPVGDCRPELWIFTELARRLAPGGAEPLYPDLPPEAAAEAVIRDILARGGDATAGITLEDLREGPRPLGTAGEIPFARQVEGGVPFGGAASPWLKTGRMEFYREEEAFLRLGEALPVHKPPLRDTEYAGGGEGDYPFLFLARSGVHRVHGTHGGGHRAIDEDGARVWLNPSDGDALGIACGDGVRVCNARGEFVAEAVLDPGIHPGTVAYEGAWWSRFTRGAAYTTLVRPHIKPTAEAYFSPDSWAPNMAWNECACRVERLG